MGEVLDHRRCILFRRFTGGVGRTAQAQKYGVSNGQGRWPMKSAKILLDLLRNAEFQQVTSEKLFVDNVVVNRSTRQKRRTYRAHGRLNPMNSTLCHIDIVLGFRPRIDPKKSRLNNRSDLRKMLTAFVEKSY